MSLKSRTAALLGDALSGSLRWFGERNRARVAGRLGHRLPPIKCAATRWGELRFVCEGETAWWRAENLLTKEPETIEWIDGFHDDDVFWDVGANVGTYALYAALRAPGGRVLAFEPAPVNYEALQRNVDLNGLGDQVCALCLALSDRTAIARLSMVGAEPGGTLHQLGGSSEAVTHLGRSFCVTSTPAALGFAVDRFVELFAAPFPNHIKIDVDGIEERVLAGAERTLADRRLRSVLVELDVEREQDCRNVIARLAAAGLRLDSRRHAPEHDAGPFASLYNHIFVRD